MTDKDLIKECQVLISELIEVGSFYYSAIELDTYAETNGQYVDGEEFEKRFIELKEKLDQKIKCYENNGKNN